MKKTAKFMLIPMLLAVLIFAASAAATKDVTVAALGEEGVHVSTLFLPHPTVNKGTEKILAATSINGLPAHMSSNTNKGALISLEKSQDVSKPVSRVISKPFVISDNTADDLLVRVRPAPAIDTYNERIKDTVHDYLYDGNKSPTNGAYSAVSAGIQPSIRDITIIVSDAVNPAIYFEVFIQFQANSGALYDRSRILVKANNQIVFSAESGNGTLASNWRGADISASYWNYKGNEDFIPLYYDAADNKLYTILRAETTPKVIRDFNNTYDNKDSVWGGFPSGRATVDVQYAGGGGVASLLVSDIDGLSLATDSSGNLLQANVDAYNAKATSFYGTPTSPEEVSGVMGANALSALKANSLLGNQIALSLTEQYTVTIKDADDNDITAATVTGLNSGKYTADAVFLPPAFGTYTIEYELSGELYSTVINVAAMPEMTANYSQGELTVSVLTGGYDYQYWIKQLVDTDIITIPVVDGDDETQAIEQYVWLYGAGFTDEVSHTFEVSDKNVIDGNYQVIVRARSGNSIAWEQLFTVTPAEAGAPQLESVFIDGIPAQLNGYNIISSSSVIMVNGNDNTEEYALYLDGNFVVNSAQGVFDFSEFAGLEFGTTHRITVAAENGSARDVLSFTAYFTEDYQAADTLTIHELDGITVNTTTGQTDFTLELRYADGGIVSQAVLDNLSLRLSVAGHSPITTYTPVPDSNTATVKMSVNLKGTGIFYTTAEIFSGNKRLDFYSKYYGGNKAASVALEQTADKVQGTGVFTLNSTGTVNGSDDVQYAYYREDVGGYSLIKDYSIDGELVWSAVKSGKYVIQTRIKGAGSYSYEHTVSNVYTVTDELGELNSDIDVKVKDKDGVVQLESGGVISVGIGQAYVINANYENASSNVLYKYVIAANHIPSGYLTRYSPSGEVLFYFYKKGTYTFTVRVLDHRRQGYADSSTTITIVAE